MLTADQAVKSNGKPPRDRYILRCIKQDFKPENSNKEPMITLEWEFIGVPTAEGKLSETVVNEMGEVVQIVGAKAPTYFTLAPGTKLDRFFTFQGRIGYNNKEVDETNPLEKNNYVGLTVDALCDSDENIARKNPTPEQQKAKQPGDPILDREGKQIVSYRPKIVEIYGIVTMETGRPF